MSNSVVNHKDADRSLVAVLACRNQGSRLYGKPIQNLDVDQGVTILDNIVACLETIESVDKIVLAISEGGENEVFVGLAKRYGIGYVMGDEQDVLSRLIKGGLAAKATDVFRVTSESPFPSFDLVDEVWERHQAEQADGTFLDEMVDGCGFEILRLSALEESHEKGDSRHRSELCTLYLRENADDFHLIRIVPDEKFVRKDLRLTVDNPEDLAVCRHVYAAFRSQAPRIPVANIIQFLDDNPALKEMVAPFTELGYSTMYVWNES